jgi:hypothetical protein
VQDLGCDDPGDEGRDDSADNVAADVAPARAGIRAGGRRGRQRRWRVGRRRQGLRRRLLRARESDAWTLRVPRANAHRGGKRRRQQHANKRCPGLHSTDPPTAARPLKLPLAPHQPRMPHPDKGRDATAWQNFVARFHVPPRRGLAPPFNPSRCKLATRSRRSNLSSRPEHAPIWHKTRRGAAPFALPIVLTVADYAALLRTCVGCRRPRRQRRAGDRACGRRGLPWR